MMQRSKLRKPVAILSSSTTSEPLVLNSFVWFTIEVPDADKAKAITIQTLSAITGLWEDVLVLSDITNKYKGLTATEMATVGCLDQIRLKFASAPAANGNVYFHLSS